MGGHKDLGLLVDYYASRLREIGRSRALDEGRRLHAQISARCRRQAKIDTYLRNLVVQMYGKCGSLEDARAAFDGIRNKNVFSWNILIAAYAENGHFYEAIGIFYEMAIEPSRVTFLSVITACSGCKSLANGEIIHSRVLCSGLGSDITVANSLINMYSKCQRLDRARYVFCNMPEKNVISWTSMIDACVQCGDHREALVLFMRMDLEGVTPNELTFSSVLSSCSLADQGKALHTRIVACGYDSDVGVANALVSMYGRCESLDEATTVFEKMSKRDLVSWTALITAFAQTGHHHHARRSLYYFDKMVEQGMVPDEITFVSVLDACSCAGALVRGREVHKQVVSRGFDTLVPVRNALVNMYGKCGKMDEARSLFDSTKAKNIVSWTAMVSAYAQHGHSEEAQWVFRNMELEGIQPTAVTFTSILYACSHGGSLSQGHQYFLAMRSDERDISPLVEHYHCLIDLLGRSGQLEAAEELIRTMPFEADIVPWMTFLGSCSRLEIGMRAAEEILKRAPETAGPYVLVSNVCAAAGRWDFFTNVRQLMDERGVLQDLGCSYVEVGNRVHEFVANDTSHECHEEVYAELRKLQSRMKQHRMGKTRAKMFMASNLR